MAITINSLTNAFNINSSLILPKNSLALNRSLIDTDLIGFDWARILINLPTDSYSVNLVKQTIYSDYILDGVAAAEPQDVIDWYNANMTSSSGAAIQVGSPFTGGTNYAVVYSDSNGLLQSATIAFNPDNNDWEISGFTIITSGNGGSLDYSTLGNLPNLFDGQYSSLSGTPNLASVATSGNYSDLNFAPYFAQFTSGASTGGTTVTFPVASSNFTNVGVFISSNNCPPVKFVTQTGGIATITFSGIVAVGQVITGMYVGI